MAEFDQYAESYKAMLNESLATVGGLNDYYLSKKVEFVIRKFDNTSPERILDFGCGVGAVSAMLKGAYTSAEVIGADISENSLDIARSNCSDVSFENLTDQNFVESNKGSFDLIFIANVFHHIPLPDRGYALSLLKRLLAAKGKIFFFEHNPCNPATRWVVHKCEFDKDAILLTPKLSRSLFASAGFRIEDVSYILFFPPQLGFLTGFEKVIEKVPMGAQYCVISSLEP
jgi:ubiquinone/menaquinone biosynthesis C-methylase UbiE